MWHVKEADQVRGAGTQRTRQIYPDTIINQDRPQLDQSTAPHVTNVTATTWRPALTQGRCYYTCSRERIIKSRFVSFPSRRAKHLSRRIRLFINEGKSCIRKRFPNIPRLKPPRLQHLVFREINSTYNRCSTNIYQSQKFQLPTSSYFRYNKCP